MIFLTKITRKKSATIGEFAHSEFKTTKDGKSQRATCRRTRLVKHKMSIQMVYSYFSYTDTPLVVTRYDYSLESRTPNLK